MFVIREWGIKPRLSRVRLSSVKMRKQENYATEFFFSARMSKVVNIRRKTHTKKHDPMGMF